MIDYLRLITRYIILTDLVGVKICFRKRWHPIHLLHF